MDPITYFMIIVICIVVSAFFSGSETALLRLPKSQIDSDVKTKSNLSVMAARELVKSPAKLLVTILLGNNIVNILAAACASSLGIYYFGEQKGLVVATIVMTAVVLIFAEILPKAVAARRAREFSYLVSLPLYMIHKILTPVHFLYEYTMAPLVIMLGGKTSDGPSVSIAESVLKMAEQIVHKKPDGSPLPIISAAAKAGSLSSEDVMVHRSDIFALPITTSIQEAEYKIGQSCYTRALVFKNDIDEILGSIHLKDLVRANNSDSEPTLESIVKPVLTVAERTPILEILPKMQKAFIHIAVVADEFGVTQGVLTQEDVLEEIVGEIRDEFDRGELGRIRMVNVNKYDVLGKVSVHDFNKESHWLIDAPRSDSLSGLVYNHLGEIPKPGDIVNIGDYELKVKDVSGRKIARIEISKKTSS